MANQKIDELSIEVNYSANNAATGVDQLKNSLSGLASITSSSVDGLSKINSQLNKFTGIGNTLNGVNFDSFGKNIKTISDSMTPFSELSTSNLTKFINQLKKIPDLNESLDTETVSQFTKKINELSTALGPLAQSLSKVQSNLSNLPSKLNKVTNYASKAKKTVSGISELSSLLNFGAATAIFQRIGSTLGDFVTKSNAYVEDLNLFTVAMGKSADEAKKWIDTASEALGLDPSGMMRYMGVFNMIGTGFGLASDQAYKMSKNLTQLTYDISSFYNIKIDEAAQKVQSAIAGKIICLIRKKLCMITYLIAGNSKRVMA